MIFGKRGKNVSPEAATDRTYGIYDNRLVIQYKEPLTDKQI